MGILGPPMDFDLSRSSKWLYMGSKAMVPTMSPKEVDLPWLVKYCVFYLFVVGNGGLLMLACSNVHVSGEFSIFGNAFSTAF